MKSNKRLLYFAASYSLLKVAFTYVEKEGIFENLRNDFVARNAGTEFPASGNTDPFGAGRYGVAADFSESGVLLFVLRADSRHFQAKLGEHQSGKPAGDGGGTCQLLCDFLPFRAGLSMGYIFHKDGGQCFGKL